MWGTVGTRQGWGGRQGPLVEMLSLHHSLNVCTGQRAADNPEDSSIQVVSKEYAGSDTQQVYQRTQRRGLNMNSHI